jgi:hypothetical protein
MWYNFDVLGWIDSDCSELIRFGLLRCTQRYFILGVIPKADYFAEALRRTGKCAGKLE